MESSQNIVCPVCTLYLRPGMTLESHLTSHPKQKVIEALIKVSQLPLVNVEKLVSDTEETNQYSQLPSSMAPNWSQAMNVAAMNPQVPTNHSFIYQQFMSSTGTQPILNVNPMAQQFVAVPTVINPQMFCSPYVFQQQQQLQIVSSNPNIQTMVRPPLNIVNNEITNVNASTTTSDDIPVSPKHVDSSTSTDLEIQESTKNEIEIIDVEQQKTESKDESIEVYPDMYANNVNESYEEQEASVIIVDKPCKKINIVEEIIIDPEEEETKELNEEGLIKIQEFEEVMINEMKGKSQCEETEENLDKACQTLQATELCESKDIKSPIEYVSDGYCADEVILSDHGDQTITVTVTSVPTPQIQIDTVYSISKGENICLPSSSNLIIPDQNVTLLEIDDMNFMISNDFLQSGKTILSKVEDYECIKEVDGNKIIMEIGEEKIVEVKDGIKRFCDEKLNEESMSRESLNIHADERMPPRGELSEQESNGASDIAWGRVYNEQECSSGMSTSYDLLARESWEASDCSDSEMPPLQSRIPPPTLYIEREEAESPPLKKPITITYSCTTCGESFSCPKERRVHQQKEHSSSSSSTTPKKRVRQTRKTRTPTIKEENNFEMVSVITKSEPTEEQQEVENNVEPVKQEAIELAVVKQEDGILCPMCGEFSYTTKEYNKHLSNVHKIASEKNKCKTCLEVFSSEVKYTEHLKIHPLECNLCGKNFYRRYNLRIHLKRHYNIRPFKCETCHKGFLTKQKLQEHTNVHTGNAPIRCTMCEETFRRHSNLVQHRNKHHYHVKKKYKDYICHCGEIFRSKNKLNWHKETHDTKPKSCTYCNEKFIHMASLTRHIRRSHNQKYVPKGKSDMDNVECHICHGVYFKNSLEVHLQTHLGRRQHVCLICGKEFTTKWNLKLHKWTHASRTSKPYKCEQCNGAFIRQTDYQAHLNSHKSIRPYTCNYCGCKFIRKYNCQRHVREHEETKSYTCTVCNKSFHRSYYLKEHMRVHSGARPFACHICGKTSTTKSNHNKHMKIHHAREPVSTEG